MRDSAVSLWSTRRFAGMVTAFIFAAGCSGPSEPPLRVLHLEAVSDTSLTGIVGAVVTPIPTVRVTDEDGQPVAGVQVSFIVVGNGATRNRAAFSGADGRASVGYWTLGVVAGPQRLTAIVNGATQVAFIAIAAPGTIGKVLSIAGDFQSATVGAPLQHPLRVRVADIFDNSVPGATVMFTATTGDGTIDGEGAITDGAGIATSGTWTLGAVPGQQLVHAKAGAAQGVFTATACLTPCQEIQLLFVRDGLIYRTNILGGDVRVLSNRASASSPSWSPDGQRIAFGRFSRNDLDLYVMNADGTNEVLRAERFHSPSWSPDGTRLAVTRGNCWYACQLSLLNVDDTSTAPVPFAAMAAQPAWSPDGKKIAFVSLSGDDGYHELQVLNTDGTGLTVISRRDPGVIYRPAWSADGRRIAFSKCHVDGCNIYSANADGSGLTRLTAIGNAINPSWSPDGIWIAFEILKEDWFEASAVAYIASSGGGNVVPLLDAGYHPAWRPMTSAQRK